MQTFEVAYLFCININTVFFFGSSSLSHRYRVH